MEWKDLAATIGRNAPMLGTLLGGPAGAAVGAVGAMIASALGVGDSPEEVRVALADPAAAVKLREIESARSIRLQELVLDQARIAAEDRKDARGMQIATRSKVPALLAILVTVGFFGVLGSMLAGIWKPDDNNALLILLGSLGTSWGAIVNFYFGSSASSDRKTELLARSEPAK